MFAVVENSNQIIVGRRKRFESRCSQRALISNEDEAGSGTRTKQPVHHIRHEIDVACPREVQVEWGATAGSGIALVVLPDEDVGAGIEEGLGKGGARRHRKFLRDNIQGITKPAIRHLARRGGVKRTSGLIY
ncbi:hypothetical protein B0H11DRAFT_1933132 [Mycena galericulata]|nr:hypothetical protein B0H11DRAFT_1933132 [Mycena galericulata]